MSLDFNLCWEKIQHNEESALEELYKAAFRPLAYYAGEITGQPQIAEEVVDDVFLKIWKNRSALSVKGSFKAYLFQSVHNQSLNYMRKLKTRTESVNLVTSDATWKFISENFDINDYLIERIFSNETEAKVNRIISELPEQCRRVFLMSRLESIDNKKIAARLGLSENTVKTHLYRALQKISDSLAKEK